MKVILMLSKDARKNEIDHKDDQFQESSKASDRVKWASNNCVNLRQRHRQMNMLMKENHGKNWRKSSRTTLKMENKLRESYRQGRSTKDRKPW